MVLKKPHCTVISPQFSCAGSVSLAGADSGLWAVDGGNKRVCSGLLYHSKAELISAHVTNIALKMRPSKSGTALVLTATRKSTVDYLTDRESDFEDG